MRCCSTLVDIHMQVKLIIISYQTSYFPILLYFALPRDHIKYFLHLVQKWLIVNYQFPWQSTLLWWRIRINIWTSGLIKGYSANITESIFSFVQLPNTFIVAFKKIPFWFLLCLVFIVFIGKAQMATNYIHLIFSNKIQFIVLILLMMST